LLLNFYHRTQEDQCCSHACLPISIAHADPAYLAAVLPLSDRLNSMNSTLSGRLYDSRVNQQALLGPRRPRPHKIWKKKFIKVHSALRVLWVLAFSEVASLLACSHARSGMTQLLAQGRMHSCGASSQPFSYSLTCIDFGHQLLLD
jgi:hypothetical protein